MTSTAKTREILVHLNVEVPEADERTADAIADAILSRLVGDLASHYPLYGLRIVCPLAEEM